ncbi:MAG: nicotinate-nucleotide--dimethylbenzimidazole phosphoribosyltransferase, partial [Coriobacteriales bacterium]|nr:nicotinate-nucleotide--dimethylbenzimidazole phosphoribosyltransferase [Coriobacteriales bacterium]
MLDLKQINESIPGLDQAAQAAAVEHWNSVAKPIGSLGVLEDIVVQIAGLQASEQVDISKRCVIAMCADNGVVAQGVSQSGPEVTTLIADNMHKNISSVCVMAKTAGIDVIPVDMGMVTPVDGVRDHHITRGTADMTLGPAMTREQALAAIEVGIGMVAEVRELGYKLVVSGEMGIGNTTTSSAVASVLL